MDYEYLLTELAGGVLTVTLNRPERLNAVNPPMGEEMRQLIDEIDRDDAVRAVVFTGAGRAFCAGADLTHNEGRGGAFDYTAESEQEAHRDGGGRTTLEIFACKKPLIAAINGPAVGFGATLTLPMDVRIATPEARFGFVFARRAIVPDACASWFLPRVVGIGQAMEWVATGRIFSADEALAGGLVSQLVAPEALLPTAQALAAEIAENTSAVSVALTRQLMWKMLGARHPMEAHRIESRAIYSMGRSADGYEGVKSFLEKRAPRFSMKVSSDMPDFFPWWEEPPFGT